MKKNILYITLIIIVIVVVGLAYYFISQQQVSVNEDIAMKEDGDSMIKEEDDKMMEKEGNMEGDTMVKYSGDVLAGTSAPLLDFNKTDYELALTSDKLIVLYFYADWCPICRAEFPKMQEAFNELTTEKVIGFRVNYNDSQTDNDEVGLAREFGVAYQHTKVFVKNGQRVLKSPESWDKSRYFNEINKY